MMSVFKQSELGIRFRPGGGVNAQKAHQRSGLPIPAEQRANFLKQFGIQLRGAWKGMSPGQRSEVCITQLQLERASRQLLLAEPAAYHFAKARERGFQHRPVRSILAKGMF